MNVQETLELIAVLRASGVVKFKSLEHDIVFADAKSLPASPIQKASISSDSPTPENPEATAKARELINLAKMTPEELANQIFPDGAL
jgi:hypothetical protein